MNKRILSIILVLSMLVGVLAVIPVTVTAAETNTNVWDGSVATSFADGDGTEDNPYQISNGAELALMSKKITEEKDGNYNRAHYVLTADIVLNDMPHVSTWYDGWYNGDSDAYEPENMFIPIGTWSTATSSFGGTFDGDGHTISGAYFYTDAENNEDSPTGGVDNHGLFGAIQGGAVIKNFSLVNSLFGNEAGNIAAIVGTTDRESAETILIENIYIDAYVYGGGDNVGGVLGNVSNSGNSSSGASYTPKNLTVNNVTFAGHIQSGGQKASGIIADARNAPVSINNCLVVNAKIEATKNASGFLSKMTKGSVTQTINNCIIVNTKIFSSNNRTFVYSNQSTSNNKPKVNNCFYMNVLDDVDEAVTLQTNATLSNVSEITDSTLLYKFYDGDKPIDWDGWVFPEKANEKYDMIRPKGVAEAYTFALVDAPEPPKDFENGSGTEEDPYKIANAEDLALLSELSQKKSFAGVYFELTNDITLTGENNHQPIGTWGTAFGGIFDGNGKTISGAHIVTAGDGSGFFACIQGGAVIKNLSLVDSYYRATGTSGAVGMLVGQTNRANDGEILIENVYVDAEVVGNGASVAGIIGNLSNTESGKPVGKVTVNNAVVTGSISGTTCVAGIIGDARNVEVEVTNCLVAAEISGTGAPTAGIMARSNNNLSLALGDQIVSNCIVASDALDGTAALVAANGTALVPSVSDCYYTADLEAVVNCDTDACEYVHPYDLFDLTLDWEGWVTLEGDIARPDGVAANAVIKTERPAAPEPPLQFAQGSGIEEDPYLISDAEQLAVLSQLSQADSFVGVYFKLTNDITLTGENNHQPIGNWNYAFGGTFDGNGKTISGVHIKNAGDGSGFFACIQGGAVIKNLALVDAYYESTGAGAVGMLVGQTNRASDDDIIIENIFVDADVVAKGGEVAGIIGNLTDKGTTNYEPGTVYITDVVFTGSVTATGNCVAGIVGNARMVTVEIKNTLNAGKIKSSGKYVAGILASDVSEKNVPEVGSGEYDENGDEIMIKIYGDFFVENCVNIGKITGKDVVCAISAYAETDANNTRRIVNCIVLKGAAEGGTSSNANAPENLTTITEKTKFIGANATIPAGFTARANDYAVPTGCTAASKAVIYKVELLDGAAVRLSDPSGLRFTAVLGANYLNSFMGEGKTVSYGIILTPTDYVQTAGAFTIEALAALGHNVNYKEINADQYANDPEADGYYVFTGVLAPIQTGNYNRAFSAIAYVKVVDADGNVTYYYSDYDASVNSRSIAQVAEAAYADTNNVKTDYYQYALDIEVEEEVEGTITNVTKTVYSPYTVDERNLLLGFTELGEQ